jgi:hypothetical protein
MLFLVAAARMARSSYYSDYTFGVWSKKGQREELVPVGKAYFDH